MFHLLCIMLSMVFFGFTSEAWKNKFKPDTASFKENQQFKRYWMRLSNYVLLIVKNG